MLVLLTIMLVSHPGVLQDNRTHLVNGGGQVTVAADAFDIRQVLVALNQGLLVLMPLPLTRQQGAHLYTRLCLQCKNQLTDCTQSAQVTRQPG